MRYEYPEMEEQRLGIFLMQKLKVSTIQCYDAIMLIMPLILNEKVESKKFLFLKHPNCKKNYNMYQHQFWCAEKKNYLNGTKTFPDALKALTLPIITHEGNAKKYVGRNGVYLILMGFSNLSRNFSVFIQRQK